MERKLLSKNDRRQKGAAVFIFIVFVLLPLTAAMLGFWIEPEYFILPLLFAPAFFISYRAFTKKHPVYFDSSFIYWGENGSDCLDLRNIERAVVSISQRGIRGVTGYTCLLIYCNETNKVGRIRFALAEADFPFLLMMEFERAVQCKKPAFKVDGIYERKGILS